ncbi:MAG: N-6 DNA methylase, partial [Planctomycetaceae bacterium]|nr:N-6 DNA methylase [Planctomycetaceae bacterium]
DLFDLEYSQTIDPEFIGKVFESLLACIDADTKENRRKTTVSFYTPREIVDYMVNESLDAYLQNNNDLLQCKILDPACGSGAFPCSIMNEIMRRIDPDKKLSQQERYHKKLEILQKVIYCVDIQSMAVQISSLRLFLSLIQEIIPDKKKDNYGIEPLPNLETKFVCANTLIGLKKEKQGRLELPEIKRTVKQLKLNREQHFMASTVTEKERLRKYDNDLRKLLSEAMEDAGALSHETAKLLLQWNPYDQTKSTPFFDPQWMFGIDNGFDIVIGNPPYVFARNSKSKGFSEDSKAYYYEHYELSEYQINLYPLFFEKGTNLLTKNGYLTYITPNNWLTLNTNQKLRRFILEKSNITIVVFYKRVFANADVDSAVVLFQNTKSTDGKIKLAEWDKQYNIIGELEKQKLLATKDCIINVEVIKESETFNILDKIENNSVPISSIADVKVGLKAYQIGKGSPKQTKEMKNNRVFHAKTRNDKNYIKYLDGKDVCRYSLGWNGEYLKYGKHLAEPRSNFDLFSTPRILVRQIPSPLPYCINACYTEEILLNDLNSMNIIYIKVSPLYLLGILNSKIISYWFAHKFGKLQRGIFPQFKINELAQFPIPNITPKKQQPIIDLVNQILSAKIENPNTDTTKLESKIDRLVYKLYNLTEQEIKIIEG